MLDNAGAELELRLRHQIAGDALSVRQGQQIDQSNRQKTTKFQLIPVSNPLKGKNGIADAASLSSLGNV